MVPAAALSPQISKQREAVAIPERFYIRRAAEFQVYGYTCGWGPRLDRKWNPVGGIPCTSQTPRKIAATTWSSETTNGSETWTRWWVATRWRGWWTGTAGAAMDWRRRRNKSLETQFCFEDRCRETSTRCRGKGQTSQEIQVWRVRIVSLGAAVAMDAQMGKIAQVGKVTMEEQLIQNIVMNTPKCKIGRWIKTSSAADSCDRVRRVLQEPVHESSIPLGGCILVVLASWHTIGNVENTPLKWRSCAAQSDSHSDESSWRSWHENCLRTSCEIHKMSGAGWQLLLAWSRAPWSKLEQIIDPWHADEWLVQVKAGRGWSRQCWRAWSNRCKMTDCWASTRWSRGWRDTTCKRGKKLTLQILPRVDVSTVAPRTSETCQDQRGCVPAHVERENLWIRS